MRLCLRKCAIKHLRSQPTARGDGTKGYWNESIHGAQEAGTAPMYFEKEYPEQNWYDLG